MWKITEKAKSIRLGHEDFGVNILKISYADYLTSWMKGWRDEWINELMKGWMNECHTVCKFFC